METSKIKKNIPSGWKQVKLGDICDFKKGKGLPKDDLTNDGKHEAIHYGELFTKYREKIKNILSKTNNNKSVFLSKKNDILMPTSDVTPRGLSTASFINKDGVILGGDILVIRPKSNILNGLFLSNFVSSQKKEVMRLVSGTTVFHLYGSDMAKLCFNLPPLAEQNRIVAVLEVWDGGIEKLKKKIEIKKNIKKGLMQELLTGKTRLPGFSGEWEAKRLREIFDKITRGNVLSTKKIKKQKSGSYIYPVYSSQTFKNGLLGYYNDYLFENAITWTTDGANAGEVKYREGKFYCTNVCGVLLSDKDFSNICISGLIARVAKKYVSYVGNPKLMNNVMEQIEIFFPKDIKEQKAIAKILTTADKEIKVLEEKLKIFQEQKRFLLNNLITGKIRTPEDLKINE